MNGGANNVNVLVVGVGNAYRGDDAAGIAVARHLRAQVEPCVRVIELGGEAAGLAESWKGADSVIVVDAIQSGAPPGSIRRFDARTDRIPREIFGRSTHDFGLAAAIELARALNELPPRLVIYAIEGEDFTPREKLSSRVEEAVESVAEEILSESSRLE